VGYLSISVQIFYKYTYNRQFKFKLGKRTFIKFHRRVGHKLFSSFNVNKQVCLSGHSKLPEFAGFSNETFNKSIGSSDSTNVEANKAIIAESMPPENKIAIFAWSHLNSHILQALGMIVVLFSTDFDK